MSNLNPVASDLVELASFIYWADSSVRRGTAKEVFGGSWKRDFVFVLPVRKLKVWQLQAVQEALVEVLSYLTGDHYIFYFTQSDGLPEQLIFKDLNEAVPWCPKSDIIALFSGGLDSLAGAIYLQRSGRRPILVCHRSMPGIDTRQKLLVQYLKECIPSWQFPHLSVWVHRQREDAIEYSQRSRGFLYLALAATAGQELNIYDIATCENGVVAFNLPRAGQTPGTLRSRSTDPHFLSTFSQLMSLLFDHQFHIFNPFLFLTRTEVVKTLVEAGHADLVPASVSCTHTRRSFAKLHPHCGTCYQCVDRRFAIAAAGLETTDELDSYEKDLFIHSLGEGDERTSAENTVRFA